MSGPFKQAAKQEAAQTCGEASPKASQLDVLQEELDLPKPTPKVLAYWASTPTADLERKLSRLQSVSGRLPDSGAIKATTCQEIQAVLKHRAAPAETVSDRSKQWNAKAKANQAEANQAGAGQDKQHQMHSSHPQTTFPGRNQMLTHNRDFSDAPSASQAKRRATSDNGVQGTQTAGSQGHKATNAVHIGKVASVPYGAIPLNQGPSKSPKFSTRQSSAQYVCDHCHKGYPMADIRWQKLYDGDDHGRVCHTCWQAAHGDTPWAVLNAYMIKTLTRMQAEMQGCNQGLHGLQPAPVKCNESAQSTLNGQPSQTQGGKKVTARQSAKMQKHQQQKQEDNEPICIDSDEGDHAAGSVPARDSDQNGAAPALRRSERSNITKSTIQIFKDLRCVYPLDRKLDVVEMTEHDLSRLDNEEFLNDTVIDFYAKWIQEHLDPDSVLKFHFFNTFFFKKLTEKSTLKKNLPGNAGREGTPDSDAVKALTSAQRNHMRVKAWTKGVDIFSKDFLLIPIHDALHWSLIIVCHPGLDFETSERRPYILHLDSMEGSCHNLAMIGRSIRSYLNVEWQRKLDEKDVSSVPYGWAKDHLGVEHSFEPSTMPGKNAHVPRQDNYCDCGLFVLAYLDFWTHAPPDQVELCEKGAWKGEAPYPAFLSKDWFQHANASALRGHIRNLILDLFRQQKRLPDDHPSTLAAVADMEDYKERSDMRKYCSPAEYLAAAKTAHKKREEEKVKREQRLKEEKERKAIENSVKQAETQRKAGEKAAERAEQRKRKQENTSQQDEIEVDLYESGGSDKEPSPPGSALPTYMSGHQSKIEEASCKRKRILEGGQQSTDVQDLTAESPDDQGKARMRLRSGNAKVHSSPGLADTDIAVTRRSSRHASAAKHHKGSSDEDEDVEPSAKRQLDMPIIDQDLPQIELGDRVDADDTTLIPDSQPEEVQPVTQDLIQEDHMTAEDNSADIVEAADMVQQSQSQQGSGFDDDVELREHEVIDSKHTNGMSLQQQQQKSGSSYQPAVAGPSGQWNNVLLTSGLTNSYQQTPQQTKFERLKSVQQNHLAQMPKPFNPMLQDVFYLPQANDGYSHMQVQGSFDARKINGHFGGVIKNHASHLSPVKDQRQVPMQDPSAVPGYSHEDTDGSVESNDSCPAPNPAAGLHQSPPPHSASTPAASPSHGPLPFPAPLSVLKSATFSEPPAQFGYPVHCDSPHPDTVQAQHPAPPKLDPNLPVQSPANRSVDADTHTNSVSLPTKQQKPVQEDSPANQQSAAHQAANSFSDSMPVSSPSQGVRAGRRAAKSYQHRDMPLAARSVAVVDMDSVLRNVPLMTVSDRPNTGSPVVKRAKLSPLHGVSSPDKPSSAQWPANASAMHQHGLPAPLTPTAVPVSSTPADPVAAATSNGRPAVINSGRQTPQLLDIDSDLEPLKVASLCHGVERAPDARAPASQPPAGSNRAYLLHHHNIVCNTEADVALAFSDLKASAAVGQQETIDIDGRDSAQSLLAAEASGAQLQKEFRQQQAQHAQPSAPTQNAAPVAIDLCEDEDASPVEDACVSTANTKQQQIDADEQVAREMQLQQTGTHLQQFKLQDPGSDSNAMDWNPSSTQGKQSQASGRKTGAHRRARQTQSRDPNQSTLHFGSGLLGTDKYD